MTNGWLVSATTDELDQLESPPTTVLPSFEQNNDAVIAGPLTAGCRYAQLASSCNVHVEPHVRSPWQITRARLVQLICAMLNGTLCGGNFGDGGGKIYYGVTTNGRVFGIGLTRQQRDALAIGIDEALTNVKPRPLAHNCHMSFVPVQRSSFHTHLPSTTTAQLFIVVVQCRTVHCDEVFIARPLETVYVRCRQPEQHNTATTHTNRADSALYVVRSLDITQVRTFLADKLLTAGLRQLAAADSLQPRQAVSRATSARFRVDRQQCDSDSDQLEIAL